MLSKVILGLSLVLTGCSYRNDSVPRTNSDYAKSSVMITSLNGRAGGSGVIYRSYPDLSQVLTNKHVCELIQVGGLVVTDDGAKYNISSFRIYPQHDLCMITVPANLHENTRIAEKSPEIYSEMLTVGHPALMPTILSKGNFAKVIPIKLMVGMAPCDGTESADDAVACIFMGAKPNVKTMNAQATSSLIMAGSSGSGVFNSKGEIVGLIFAGPSDGVGFGYAVPFTYLADFLDHVNTYPVLTPDKNKKPESFMKVFTLNKYCNASDEFEDLCREVKLPGVYLE